MKLIQFTQISLMALSLLKFIAFGENNFCVKKDIGCETCLISQADQKKDLQGCFDNCPVDTICLSS
jgi:hypothetical protein